LRARNKRLSKRGRAPVYKLNRGVLESAIYLPSAAAACAAARCAWRIAFAALSSLYPPPREATRQREAKESANAADDRHSSTSTKDVQIQHDRHRGIRKSTPLTGG